jgi:hypothetical protein
MPSVNLTPVQLICPPQPPPSELEHHLLGGGRRQGAYRAHRPMPDRLEHAFDARRPFATEDARRKTRGKTPAPISPLALEAVGRVDAPFEIEHSIIGQVAEQRRAVRREHISVCHRLPLESWMREQRAKLSRGNEVAKAIPASSTISTSACKQCGKSRVARRGYSPASTAADSVLSP